MQRIARNLTAALLGAVLLAGCATSYKVESNVQAFTSASAVSQPLSYRFERMPSQQVDPRQVQLEALADPALVKAGLKRDDAAAHYTVQVAARTGRTLSPWSDPWDWGWGAGIGGRRWGMGLHRSFGRYESLWYAREVSIVVREAGSSKVVFESHATNDGPWSDNPSVLSAMFEAALQGFPNPPAGPRRVDVTVGAR